MTINIEQFLDYLKQITNKNEQEIWLWREGEAKGKKYREFVNTHFSQLDKYEKDALRVIISSAFINADEGKWIIYSRDANEYKKNRYVKVGFRYPTLPKMVDLLVGLKLLEHKESCCDWKNEIKLEASSFRATGSLIEKLEQVDVAVRRNETLILSTKVKRRNSKKKKSVEIDYIDNRTTKRIRKEIERINAKQCKHLWQIDVDDLRSKAGLCVSQVHQFVSTKAYKVSGGLIRKNWAIYIQNNNKLNLIPVEYRRDFCIPTFSSPKKWNLHGRWYTDLQNLPKEARRILTVNGECVIEIDYSTHHLQILYHQKGLPVPPNPYSLLDLPRELVKRVCVIMMNCLTKEQAKSTVAGSAEYRAYKSAVEKSAVEKPYSSLEIIEMFEEQHKDVASEFYGFVGNRLMYLDSEIVRLVLGFFSDKNIPCLAIHDSFVVPASQQETLEMLMVECYKAVVQTEHTPNYKIVY